MSCRFGIILALAIPTPVFAILFFVTRRLIFHSIGRMIQSTIGFIMAVSLAVFVFTIVRHMNEHQEKCVPGSLCRCTGSGHDVVAMKW